VLLGTAMFVGGVVGFILDNTVPGIPISCDYLSFTNYIYLIFSFVLFDSTEVLKHINIKFEFLTQINLKTSNRKMCKSNFSRE
jgi:hypothetical protein